MRPKLSVTIITLNEEKNIRRCLTSVKKMADEIVVVDTGSSDGTVKIAESLGARVFEREFVDYSSVKNYAARRAKGDWIFSLDADEVVPLKLAEEVKESMKKTEFDGYLIPRRNFILGGEIKHTRWSPDKHIWLWKKDKGKWKGIIHEELVVKGNVGELTNAKLHYQHKSVTEFIEMLNRYTTLEAKQKRAKGIGFSFFRMLYDPSLSFFRRYIYKRGFLDGWRGFVLSCLMSIYRLTTWVKIWEGEL